MEEQTRKPATDGSKSLLLGCRSGWPSQFPTPAFGLQMSQSQSVLNLHKADQVSSKHCFEVADQTDQASPQLQLLAYRWTRASQSWAYIRLTKLAQNPVLRLQMKRLGKNSIWGEHSVNLSMINRILSRFCRPDNMPFYHFEVFLSSLNLSTARRRWPGLKRFLKSMIYHELK